MPMKASPALVAVLLAVAAGHVAATGEHEHHAEQAGPAAAQKPWGRPAAARDASRTIEIVMSDTMRFTPAAIEVKQGEVVKLVVRNSGKVLHELVIGTKKEFAAHAARMARQPKMEHGGADMAHVQPGATGEIAWNFNRPGTFDFACLVAGHYEAGMTGTIKVKPAAAGAAHTH
jgi:uncharacterized cupredoxin-like copper-binding protein